MTGRRWCFVVGSGDDSRRFLSAVLQCVEAVVGQDRCIRVVKGTENPTVVVWLVWHETGKWR